MQLYVLIDKEHQIYTIEEQLLKPSLASEGSSEITQLEVQNLLLGIIHDEIAQRNRLTLPFVRTWSKSAQHVSPNHAALFSGVATLLASWPSP